MHPLFQKLPLFTWQVNYSIVKAKRCMIQLPVRINSMTGCTITPIHQLGWFEGQLA